MPSSEDALALANLAVQCDTRGEVRPAIYYYGEAIKLLESVCNENPQPANKSLYQKIHEYDARAQLLQYQADTESKSAPSNASKYALQLKQCYFLFKQALEADESGLKNRALDLYTRAVEIALATNKEITDPEMTSRLKKIVVQALGRAENLKKGESAVTDEVTDSRPQSSSRPAPHALHRGNSVQLMVAGDATYSDEEKKVLTATSWINKHEYVPFMSIDLNERFHFSIPFTDRAGLLQLSPKQRSKFVRWARPDEFCSDPEIVVGQHVNYASIKQTVISDCSFVASLAVAAQYEWKFNRRIITSILFPKKRNLEPVYNPFGKYMVKFHMNGISRKVIIDDLLPIGEGNQLLCSYSMNKNELWVSLLEKAYMKVMGGYDFPGSNSNIDLHALTGWIPERCALNAPDFNGESLFNTLLTRLHKGDVLATVATGFMSEVEETRTGLVATHAYALLDVRKVQNYRLVKLKNPWSHIRWRGNFSELDLVHWTADLKRALDYNPHDAQTFDNGIFWIDFDSLVQFFDTMFMNWNPELFTHTFCIHQFWSVGSGPVRDRYYLSENPQFQLDVQSAKAGAVWVLLTRHITEIEDFKDNKEFITLLVYKNDGKRVHYPNEPEPFIPSIRINSPHYLCKIILNEDSPRYFTLVVSQLEKQKTIYYTLRAYSTCPFTLKKFPDNFKYTEKVSDGMWSESTAGGCRNHPATFDKNPVYQIALNSSSDSNDLMIDLKGPKQYQLGIEVTIIKLFDEQATAKFKRISTGDYRPGFVVMEITDAQPGLYNVMPSTYLPDLYNTCSLENSGTNDENLYLFHCPNDCGHKYKKRGHLNQHLRYECGGKKTFKCTVCEKAFARKNNWKMHMGLKHRIIM